MTASSLFSPANYLATFLIEEFGYPYPDQERIDLLEEKIYAIAAEQQISLEKIPNEEQIQELFAKVQAYIDLDEIFTS